MTGRPSPLAMAARAAAAARQAEQAEAIEARRAAHATSTRERYEQNVDTVRDEARRALGVPFSDLIVWHEATDAAGNGWGQPVGILPEIDPYRLSLGWAPAEAATQKPTPRLMVIAPNGAVTGFVDELADLAPHLKETT